MTEIKNKIKLNMDSLKVRRDWKRHKIKDGHNIYRILPPFGESSNGYPYHKWSVIWGLVDPTSGRSRPFASSITSEKKCPIFEYVDFLKEKSEQLESQLIANGFTEEVAAERVANLNKLISDLKPKTIFVYNAVDKAGDVGLLEIKSTAQKKMKSEMTEYIQTYNQDPTSLNSEDNDSGVWFDITRQGIGRDTEYDVKTVQTKSKNPQTGKITFEDDRSPLPESVVENYSNLGYDLTGVYQVKTYAELAEILEANMPALLELCPDACLTEGLTPVAVTTTSAVNRPTVKATGTKPIILKMDDEDEEEVQVIKTSKTGLATVSASADDDFMAQADALLNS